MPGKPELAHGLARNHRVEHEDDRGRHQDAERAPGLNDAGDHALVVVALEQLGQRDGGADGHAGDAQPVHRRDQHHQADGADGEPAGHAPRPHVEHAVEVVRDPRFGQHIAHEDEHRQREQRVPFHELHGGGEAQVVAAPVAPEEERGKDGDEADGGEDALAGGQHEHHQREHQDGDELVGHQNATPRSRRMSLKNSEIA